VKRRFIVTGVVATALTGAGFAAAGNAQEAVPTVGLQVSPSKVTLTGAEGLRPGPLRLVFASDGRRARDLTIFELKSGVTREQVERALRRIRSPDAAERYGKLVSGGAVARGAGYATTIPAKAATYLVIDATQTPGVRAAFTVGGEPTAAVTPAPDGTIGMREYRFDGPATLPRQGVVRFVNRGDELHFGLAVRLKRGASTRSVLRDLRRGRERIPALGSAVEALGLVSGDTTNDVEVRFRPGRYVLVCLYGDRESQNKPHSTLGMARAFRVR
jgi:hypothetical protein